MALIAAHLNAGVILVVTVSRYVSVIYINSLFPHLHRPFPPISLSLISLMIYVDVKHHVYLPAYFTYHLPPKWTDKPTLPSLCPLDVGSIPRLVLLSLQTLRIMVTALWLCSLTIKF